MTTYEVITSSNRYYAYPSLAYDGATPHLAFFRGNRELYYARPSSGGQPTWVDAVSGSQLQQNAVLDVRGGQVAIAYAWRDLNTSPDDTTIRLATRPLTDSTWLTETVESFAAGWNRPRPSLALDGAGRAHLAYYYAPDETLRHALQTATQTAEVSEEFGGLAINTVEASRSIGRSAVAVGSDARIHLAYLSRGLRYATRGPDTLTWTKQLAVPGVDAGWSTELALALDAANVPHVAYREPDQPLYHATLNDTTWVTRSVDPGANLVSAPSIGAELTNTAHITYLAIQGSNRVVRHAAFDGSAWTTETLAIAGPDAADHRQSPQLVAQNNRVYVLYADCTAYQAGGAYPINLVLATLDAGSWSTRTLYNFSGTCNGNLNYRLLDDGAGRLAAVADVWGGSGQPGWQTITLWIEGGQVTSQTTSQAGGAVAPTGVAPLGGPTSTGQVGIRGDGLEIVTTRYGQKYVQYVDRQGYRSEGTTVGATRDSWTDLYGLDRQGPTGVVVEQSGAQNTLDVEQNPPPRKPPREPQANATKTATPEGAPGVYATERITYTINLSWLGEEEALIQVRDHIPLGTSLVPGSLLWGPYIPRCQYDPEFGDVTCHGEFPSTDVELTTFVSFAVTTDCEIGDWSTPGFLNRATVYIGDYEFFPQNSPARRCPSACGPPPVDTSATPSHDGTTFCSTRFPRGTSRRRSCGTVLWTSTWWRTAIGASPSKCRTMARGPISTPGTCIIPCGSRRPTTS